MHKPDTAHSDGHAGGLDAAVAPAHVAARAPQPAPQGDTRLPVKSDGLPVESVQSPERALAQTHQLQLDHWWPDAFAAKRAGTAVRQMWRDYPFGALLVDGTWAWWSIMQIIQDGPAYAGYAGHPGGVVLASAPEGVAVLDWPDGPGNCSWLYLVAHGNTEVGTPSGDPVAFKLEKRISPERFLAIKGFEQVDRAIACAFCELIPTSRPPFATTSPDRLGRRNDSPDDHIPNEKPLIQGVPAVSGCPRPPTDPATYRSRRTGFVSAAHPPRSRNARQASPSTGPVTEPDRRPQESL